MHLWHALKMAVIENWGGPESDAKRTWLIGVVVDMYEERPPNPQNGSIGGLDYIDTEEIIGQAFFDEFGAHLEDGSPREIAGQLRKAWAEAVVGDESYSNELFAKFEKERSKKVSGFTRGEDEEIPYSGGESDYDEDEYMDQDGSAQGPSQPKPPKPEKIIDDDGFETVQKKR
ncbi:hypothetical protein E3P99_03740 [Wallemia hederae]|uniref:Pre-rRNA-processing protein TSR2 n=1 Tax=Wallemia hederae TaxID=1540922 RepID=A0A4T0FG16_9BASI|nr:hypothetical protein E3P99_03740 [Wallemia hederae]